MTTDKSFVALTRCFYCGESDRLLLNRRLGDISRFNDKVIDHKPCPKCAEWMKKGIILLTVRDGETGDNPHRTGGFAVVKEEAFKRIFNTEPPKGRMSYIEEGAAKKIGLTTAEGT